MEGALGLGYQLNNNWSLGASYRFTYTEADLSMLDAMGNLGLEIKYQSMTGTNAFGYRLGAMYRSDDDRFGWGIHYRSGVDLEAEGKTSYNNGANAGTYEGKNVTVKTELPQQVSTGAHFRIQPELTMFTELSWTNYKAVESIDFTSNDTTLAVDSLNTQWQDMYIVRFGAEYTGISDWALRTGYIYATPSVKEEYAAPTFATPDTMHTFALGAGTTFMEGKLKLDTALQYSYASIKGVKGGGQLSPASTSPSGNYKSGGISLHTSLIYSF